MSSTYIKTKCGHVCHFKCVGLTKRQYESQKKSWKCEVCKPLQLTPTSKSKTKTKSKNTAKTKSKNKGQKNSNKRTTKNNTRNKKAPKTPKTPKLQSQMVALKRKLVRNQNLLVESSKENYQRNDRRRGITNCMHSKKITKQSYNVSKI